jgi:hypothetical protein
MTSRVANISKGRVAAYAAIVQGASGSVVAIPLLTSGIVADDALMDYDTVEDLLAGATNENTTMTRKTLSSVTVTVNDTTNVASVDAADPSWTSGQMGGGAISKLCLAYSPAGAVDDGDLIPLVYLDASVTPDGNAWTYQFDAAGWYTASDPA